ncbi:hypothetical protein MANES_12G127100v8 [Manihot esculenta]|uniref:BHLH domain-containing protein n=2 Tax=Manihot esculenta TaxID=3983 RepID=A0A2C9UVP0_MANES|nr:hypothetical protein MANES_12G127100v8 [Manihot esculenta]
MHDMQPMSRLYDSGTCSKKYNFHSAANFMDVLSYKKLLATSKSKEDTKVISAQKHKEAERKRRIRINDQYANLRTVLPNLIKRNKASVLAETIQRVKELENTVSELKKIYGIGSLDCVFSDGADMLRVEQSKWQGEKLVKVMFSCEDKKKLMSEIARAVRSVKGKLVRAEIATMCGWAECVLWVQGLNGNQQMEILRTALDAVIEPRMLNNKPH